MIDVLRIPAVALIVLGLFFMIVGPLGLIRFPDFYTRAHATGKCDSLGEALILLGFILYADFGLETVKIALLIVFIYILTPTATHAIIRTAYVLGLRPWRPGEGRR
ncbi:MAG: monovalent cation/H(+) antiporter subunit G [Methanomicrobiaceae archaeon]|uniref:Na(+) h(+) antiporter subunit g n=1 Tax=hydrocarbon metagenome TaxID=938273 RepID=A0A0W8FDQ3_9ZZZZ|nr:monovalent cation/H(+) antiporter subunit G [Methanomicrobiaceae archaeon]MDD5419172.1 monovalent cation/H(+) antiporter subunit G [Methanomicrobiaceae archaeon]